MDKLLETLDLIQQLSKEEMLQVKDAIDMLLEEEEEE